jgi:hypothetical protein
MTSVKTYFKSLPTNNNITAQVIILKSKNIKFLDTTEYSPIKNITAILSKFMDAFRKKYNIPSTIPSYKPQSAYIAEDPFFLDKDKNVSKQPKVSTTNKTRKRSSKTIKDAEPSADEEGYEYQEEEEKGSSEPPEEYNEEEYQLVSDILAERTTEDTGYMVIPETRYFLNNRQLFFKFLEKLFAKYSERIKDAIAPGCDTIQSTNALSLLLHQQLISDYININTPYRGLLLFHGLGSGKTCSSIAITEQFKNTNKKVFILTPASLAPNYEKELKKCGNIIFRLNNNWKWITYDRVASQATLLETEMYLPLGFIRKNGGVWVLGNKSEKTTASDKMMNITKRASITKQIENMLNTKYTFIHYNGITKGFVKTFTQDYTINPFDNSIVIVDEVHKFVNAVVNTLKKVPKHKTEKDYKDYSASLQLYSYITNSQYSRVVLLTGTPLVNSPNEVAVIFNMLHGLIRTIECVLTISTIEKVNTDTLITYLTEGGVFKYINYIKYEPASKKLTIVRNEDGFLSSGATGSSVYYDATSVITLDEFIERVKQSLSKQSIEIGKFEERSYKHLPDSYEEFMHRFYSNRQLININQLKSRIYGLTSYYSGTPELLPKYDKDHDYIIVPIEMSQYQFTTYLKAREPEQQSEKSKSAGTGKDLFKEQSSTYRINSRLVCNFVIPDDLVSSGPVKQIDAEAESIYKAFDVDYVETVDENIDSHANLDIVRKELQQPKYLSMDALMYYSPKMHAIINNVMDPSNIGLHLVYSQFRHLHGLEVLGMALKENGFAEFKIQHNSKGWTIDISKEDMKKPKFAFYTGKEPAIVKEIILNIYNGFLDNIPSELSKQLEKISPNNNYGELIKLFMITASGAEGIDLKNTRFVHIMEPYWNNVRLEQVVGRAVRICSHKNLTPQYQNVKAFVYLSTIPSDQINKKNPNQIMMKDISRIDVNRPISTDEFLYEVATLKEKIMSQLVQVIKETSIDCTVYPHNKEENLVCYAPTSVDNKSVYTYEPNYATEPRKSINAFK